MAEARREAAQLIGADEDEIALVESTQHGLNITADAIRLREGDTGFLAIAIFLLWATC